MNDINIHLNEFDIKLVILRLASEQTLNNNPPSSDPVDYYRKSIYIPYLDSLITSLNYIFEEDNKKFKIISIHPKYFKETNKD